MYNVHMSSGSGSEYIFVVNPEKETVYCVGKYQTGICIGGDKTIVTKSHTVSEDKFDPVTGAVYALVRNHIKAGVFDNVPGMGTFKKMINRNGVK